MTSSSLTLHEQAFCNILKNARIAARKTQRSIAKVLNYSTPQFISNWERGLIIPPVATVKVLETLYKRNDFLEKYIEMRIKSIEMKWYNKDKAKEVL